MITSPISLAFKKCKKEKRPALLTYTVAGDSTKKKSLEILNSISNHADIIELGFPHNTPIADGGQIQTSAYRAIQKGIKMKDVFQIVKEFKKNNNTKPIILMGYYNMVYQFGENRFGAKRRRRFGRADNAGGNPRHPLLSVECGLGWGTFGGLEKQGNRQGKERAGKSHNSGFYWGW